MKIVLGTLKDKGDDLAAFLEPRVGVKPEASGDSIEIEDEGMRAGVKPRHVKTYIKRFLYMNGVRKNYRVFVEGKELTIQEIELGEKKEEKEEKKPSKKEEEAPTEKETDVAEVEEKEEPEAKPKAEKPKKAARKPRSKKKSGDES